MAQNNPFLGIQIDLGVVYNQVIQAANVGQQLNQIVQQNNQILQQNNQINQQLTQLSAQLQNNNIRRRNQDYKQQLQPLLDIHTGAIIPGCPASDTAINRVTGATATRILHALGEPAPFTLSQKRAALWRAFL